MTRCRALSFILPWILFSSCFLEFSVPAALAQAPRPQERLRGVLSRARLSPPLRGETTMRFSPDGRYLAIQDNAGVMLVSKDPPRLVSYIDAPFSYPVRFSSDSQSIRIVTYGLSTSTWRTSNAARIESHDLRVPGGCLSASLSPDGNLLACFSSDQDLVILRADDGQTVFANSMHNVPRDRAVVPILLDMPTAFPAPFGYMLSNTYKPLANRGVVQYPLWFSPDGKFLIAGDDVSSLRVNLSTFAKENLPSSLRKRMHSLSGILPQERALILDRQKREPPSLVSLSSGQEKETLSFSADALRLTSDPRFAVLRNRAESLVTIFDLQLNQIVPVSDCISADVHQDLLATLSSTGYLELFRLGETKSLLGMRLPLGILPSLRAVSVSSSLDKIAVAIDGAAGIFSSATGSPELSSPFFVAAILGGSNQPLLLSPRVFNRPMEVRRVDSQSRTVVPAWIGSDEGILHATAPAVLEYSLRQPDFAIRREIGSQILIDLGSVDVPYRLRGLDPATGAKLWEHNFNQAVPIPFADSQGDRFVLAWKARSEGAKEAMKAVPALRDVYRKNKIAEQDTVFEVRDSRTGKSLGAVLAQFGSGPIDFDSAYSVGSALFLIKDGFRISVFSLADGKPILRKNGLHPSANAQSKLFAVDEGSGRLGIFDLDTGARLEEQSFSDILAYTHFSTDGKKLLVLTQHQEVFVLDMSDVREHPLAPQRQSENSSAEPVDQP